MAKRLTALPIVTAFLIGFHKLDDFDTWWHLAAGRWIAMHHAIPHTDTLSHTARDHVWINLQWGFDLVLYLLHGAGGPVLLSFAGAAVFAATVAMLLRLVAARIGSVAGSLLVLVALLAAQERVTLRPELMSFLLLAAVLSVLDVARRFDDRGLFLLVPLMVIWANVHSLFVIGAFAIVCAMVGTRARPSKPLVAWGGAALAAVLINPYGLTGALFPLKLVSRINGSVPVFQTVGEFVSPFAAGASGTSVMLYKVLLAIGAAAIAAALVAKAGNAGRSRASMKKPADLPAFDWGGLVFFVGLAVVSGSARRNIALFAIGGTPFIAGCLERAAASRPRWRSALDRPPLALSAGVVALALAIGAAVVTGALYKFDNSPQEFGAGVIEGTFPERAAEFARIAQLPANLYNDMSAGGYLSWADPVGGGVFVDGRLEVYDAPFVTEYVTAEASAVRWQTDADRYGVQTAIIFHRFENERTLVGRLNQDKAWTLVYLDEVAAVFVRTAGNDAAIARAAAIRGAFDQATDAWLARPAKKWPWPAGRIEGTRAYARVQATIGAAGPAVAAYLKLVDLGIAPGEEVERRLLLARYFAANGRRTDAQEQARRILAIDPANVEATNLLR